MPPTAGLWTSGVWDDFNGMCGDSALPAGDGMGPALSLVRSNAGRLGCVAVCQVGRVCGCWGEMRWGLGLAGVVHSSREPRSPVRGLGQVTSGGASSRMALSCGDGGW